MIMEIKDEIAYLIGKINQRVPMHIIERLHFLAVENEVSVGKAQWLYDLMMPDQRSAVASVAAKLLVDMPERMESYQMFHSTTTTPGRMLDSSVPVTREFVKEVAAWKV